MLQNPKSLLPSSTILQKAVELMRDDEMVLDRNGLAERVSCSRRSAAAVLNLLHLSGQTHVSSWIRCQGSPYGAFAWGPGEDAPKPEAMMQKKAHRSGPIKEREAPLRRRPQAIRDPILAALLTPSRGG